MVVFGRQSLKSCSRSEYCLEVAFLDKSGLKLTNWPPCNYGNYNMNIIIYGLIKVILANNNNKLSHQKNIYDNSKQSEALIVLQFNGPSLFCWPKLVMVSIDMFISAERGLPPCIPLVIIYMYRIWIILVHCRSQNVLTDNVRAVVDKMGAASAKVSCICVSIYLQCIDLHSMPRLKDSTHPLQHSRSSNPPIRCCM